jgi:CRP-like cAMP-binding protein
MQRWRVVIPRLARSVACVRCGVAHVSHATCPFAIKQRERGDVLYTEGGRADRVWLLKQGVVVLSRSAHADGAAVAWTVRRPTCFLALEAIVEPTYRDTATCASSVLVGSTSRETMDALLDANARVVLEQVIATSAGDARVWTGSAVARVASWLLDAGGPGLTDGVPRHMIAELLGMQPETLSRALVQLAQAGAIEPSRREIKIVDRDRLARLAG